MGRHVLEESNRSQISRLFQKQEACIRVQGAPSSLERASASEFAAREKNFAPRAATLLQKLAITYVARHGAALNTVTSV